MGYISTSDAACPFCDRRMDAEVQEIQKEAQENYFLEAERDVLCQGCGRFVTIHVRLEVKRSLTANAN
jgi:hypothetical protein